MGNLKQHPTRILIADDSSTARMFIRRCLEIIGFRDACFLEVANGIEALVAVKEQPCTFVVTDLTMPQMDGAELLRTIRSDPAIAAVPVIVITSSGNPATVSALLHSGAVAVLPKPITPARLAAACQALPKPQDPPA